MTVKVFDAPFLIAVTATEIAAFGFHLRVSPRGHGSMNLGRPGTRDCPNPGLAGVMGIVGMQQVIEVPTAEGGGRDVATRTKVL